MKAYTARVLRTISIKGLWIKERLISIGVIFNVLVDFVIKLKFNLI